MVNCHEKNLAEREEIIKRIEASFKRMDELIERYKRIPR